MNVKQNNWGIKREPHSHCCFSVPNLHSLRPKDRSFCRRSRSYKQHEGGSLPGVSGEQRENNKIMHFYYVPRDETFNTTNKRYVSTYLFIFGINISAILDENFSLTHIESWSSNMKSRVPLKGTITFFFEKLVDDLLKGRVKLFSVFSFVKHHPLLGVEICPPPTFSFWALRFAPWEMRVSTPLWTYLTATCRGVAPLGGGGE